MIPRRSLCHLYRICSTVPLPYTSVFITSFGSFYTLWVPVPGTCLKLPTVTCPL